jgi:hypothetical protein
LSIPEGRKTRGNEGSGEIKKQHLPTEGLGVALNIFPHFGDALVAGMRCNKG